MRQLANTNVIDALRSSRELARGVNVIEGQVTNQAVAESLGLAHTRIEDLLDLVRAS